MVDLARLLRGRYNSDYEEEEEGKQTKLPFYVSFKKIGLMEDYLTKNNGAKKWRQTGFLWPQGNYIIVEGFKS